MALSAVIEDLHERLEAAGWGQTRPLWGFVLLSLREDGPSPISEIGRLLGVSKQAAAKVVDGLSEAGLVRRAPQPLDRRATAVTLTERGARFLADAESAYAQIESDWSATIGDAELAALRTGLAAVLRARYGDERPPVRPAL
jgi:DNA-binding MarR family transcriptional regulator